MIVSEITKEDLKNVLENLKLELERLKSVDAGLYFIEETQAQIRLLRKLIY